MSKTSRQNICWSSTRCFGYPQQSLCMYHNTFRQCLVASGRVLFLKLFICSDEIAERCKISDFSKDWRTKVNVTPKLTNEGPKWQWPHKWQIWYKLGDSNDKDLVFAERQIAHFQFARFNFSLLRPKSGYHRYTEGKNKLPLHSPGERVTSRRTLFHCNKLEPL